MFKCLFLSPGIRFRHYDLQCGLVGEKRILRVSVFWSIRCSRCKPCQVVLGEPGGIEHILGKGGNPDNQQRHLDLYLHLSFLKLDMTLLADGDTN